MRLAAGIREQLVNFIHNHFPTSGDRGTFLNWLVRAIKPLPPTTSSSKPQVPSRSLATREAAVVPQVASDTKISLPKAPVRREQDSLSIGRQGEPLESQKNRPDRTEGVKEKGVVSTYGNNDSVFKEQYAISVGWLSKTLENQKSRRVATTGQQEECVVSPEIILEQVLKQWNHNTTRPHIQAKALVCAWLDQCNRLHSQNIIPMTAREMYEKLTNAIQNHESNIGSEQVILGQAQLAAGQAWASRKLTP